MKKYKIGDFITFKTDKNDKIYIGKIIEINGDKIKIIFDNEAWIIIQVGNIN